MIKNNCLEVSMIWITKTYFVKLDEVRMADDLENVNLTSHSLNVRDILNFILFEDFNGNLSE
jgi:hypothetical protein